MSIESLRTKIKKKVQFEQFKNDYADIGSFIKKKRKEMQVTQDEISNGICSVSYLSKIENNQIVPNDYYVKEIMEKLNIDESIYAKSKKEKAYLERTINAIFYCDDEMLSSIYNEIYDIKHNVALNICKFGYYVYFDDRNQNEFVMMLEHIVSNLTNLEILLYLYLASWYFMKNSNYKTALEVVELSNDINNTNPFIKAMLSEMRFEIYYKLNLDVMKESAYYQAIETFQKYNNVERMIHLTLVRIESMIAKNPKYAIKLLKTIQPKMLSESERDYYKVLNAESLFQLKQYQKSTIKLKNITSESTYYIRKMVLMYEICLIENDQKMQLEVEEIMSNIDFPNSQFDLKVKYQYLKNQSVEERKMYLRDVAIPFSLKTDHVHHLEYYTHEIMDLCVETSRYKEATQHYKKYQKEIRRIEAIYK